MTYRRYLPAMPEIEIPYQIASTKYGEAVATAMDKVAVSVAAEAKKLKSEDFKWSLGYIMGDDPEGTIDPVDFATKLAAASEIYLIARGGHWKGWVPLTIVPMQIRARFDERARLICRRKQAEQEPQEGEQDESTNGLLGHLNEWLQQNPYADQRLAKVARFVLEQLTGDNA